MHIIFYFNIGVKIPNTSSGNNNLGNVNKSSAFNAFNSNSQKIVKNPK